MASHRRKQQQQQPTEQSMGNAPEGEQMVAVDSSSEGMMENDGDLSR
jgi:hypothetical protein